MSLANAIFNAASAVGSVADLLEQPTDSLMVVIPRASWKEFCNRVVADVPESMRKLDSGSAWALVRGVYFLPSLK